MADKDGSWGPEIEKEADAEQRQADIMQKEYELRKAQGTRTSGDLAKDGYKAATKAASKAYDKAGEGIKRAASAEGMARAGGQAIKGIGKGVSGAYQSAGSPHSSGGMINLFFIIAVVLTFTYGKLGYNAGTNSTFFMLGVIGWLLVFRNNAPIFSRESLMGLGKSMAIAMAAYFWPVILGYLPTGFLNDRVLLIIAGCFPVYVIWFVFVEPMTPFLQKLNKIYVWALVAIFIAYGVVAFSSGKLAIPLQGETYDAKSAFAEFYDLVKESVKIIWEKIMKISEDVQKFVVARIDYATGGQLTGQTDPDAQERLGVYIEKMEKSQKEFYDDEPVGVWGIIKAATLDEPIRMNLRCYANFEEDADEKRNDINISADSIVPSYLNIDRKDKEDVDCTFNKGRLSINSHRIYLFINFNFETTAKQKAYFVDTERAAALLRNEIDILDQYGINDKDPVAIFTEGPMKIGMDFRNMPVKLSSSNEPRTLGISLENRWEGKITGLNEMRIKIPSTMSIKDSECTNIKFTGPVAEGDQKIYTMAAEEVEKIREFEPFRAFRCPISFDDVSGILGTSPVATRFFEVEVKYDYQLDEEISLTVLNSSQLI